MQLPNLSTKNYIIEHQHDNLKELLLKKRHIDDVDYEFAFRQIAGRQRIKHKLPEFYNNLDIIYPHQINLEQSSSESTALYKKTICE
ncbi:MAG: SAM-dependent methyltransferase, partial [Paludibacter sp.]